MLITVNLLLSYSRKNEASRTCFYLVPHMSQYIETRATCSLLARIAHQLSNFDKQKLCNLKDKVSYFEMSSQTQKSAQKQHLFSHVKYFLRNNIAITDKALRKYISIGNLTNFANCIFLNFIYIKTGETYSFEIVSNVTGLSVHKVYKSINATRTFLPSLLL